jgi:hypothetical protein|tara:strand:+ start:658 stop:873 length:216 start_codon:yes stop_codon:yes gene_type:complete
MTKEGNILSFKILVDSKGNLVTELSGVPEEDVAKIFKEEEERVVINKIIKEGLVKLATLHEYLEKELQALR